MPNTEKEKCNCAVKAALLQATATIIAAAIEKSSGGDQIPLQLAKAEITHIMKALATEVKKYP